MPALVNLLHSTSVDVIEQSVRCLGHLHDISIAFLYYVLARGIFPRVLEIIEVRTT